MSKLVCPHCGGAPKSGGASHKRGQNDGVYRTPDGFREAVAERFGLPSLDLACDSSNQFGPCGIGLPQNSLEAHWGVVFAATRVPGYCWLNPPYSNIRPWAQKCAESACRILLLVPASIGAKWYRDYVLPFAHTLSVGRMSFDGVHPYPKDLMLCAYRFEGLPAGQLTTWGWGAK